MIDAPLPGRTVEKIRLSGWYTATEDGAARP
jgi:hypothetical protein